MDPEFEALVSTEQLLAATRAGIEPISRCLVELLDGNEEAREELRDEFLQWAPASALLIRRLAGKVVPYQDPPEGLREALVALPTFYLCMAHALHGPGNMRESATAWMAAREACDLLLESYEEYE